LPHLLFLLFPYLLPLLLLLLLVVSCFFAISFFSFLFSFLGRGNPAKGHQECEDTYIVV
jgi:hypothetical protein